MKTGNRSFPGKLAAVSVATGVLLAGCGGRGGSDGDANIRGIIEIAAGSRVDGDYADLWQEESDWPDGSRDPVNLPVVPVTVGGYLSDSEGEYGNGLE